MLVACVILHVLIVGLVENVSLEDAARAFKNFGIPHSGSFKEGYWSFERGELGNPCGLPPCVMKDFTPCGDGVCRCKGRVADCSFNQGRLTYIPQLPPHISHLIFTNNRLMSIAQGDFFVNVTSIETLELFFNYVSYIHPASLRPLKNLTKLNLNINRLTYSTLAPVLSVATLKHLDLMNNPLGPMPDGIFHKYPLPQLEILCLNKVGMTSLNMTVLKPLVSLNTLQLWGNHLSRRTLHTDYLPQLTKGQWLPMNSFNEYLDTCRNGDSLFPNLTLLMLAYNQIAELKFTALCMPSLQVLVLQNNLVGVIREDSFSQLPALRVVILRYNPLIQVIDRYAFRHPRLEHIDLGSSEIEFFADKIHADSFAGCPKLNKIFIDGSYLVGITERKFNRLFGQAPSLYGLVAGSSGLGKVTAAMFANMTNLMVLGLNLNKLTHIPDGTFDSLPRLRSLVLRDNKISVVRETTFSAATCRRLTDIILNGNPFECSCELRWFQQWLKAQPALFHSQSQRPEYMCDNIPNTTVQAFYVADQACLWSPAVSKFIIAGIVLLMLPLALGTALYRYRWHIRLLLYEAFRGQGNRRRYLEQENLRYDVFVSYDSEDLQWVREHLMPELEEGLGLRLCIHQRDFTPGVPIVDNIMESVQDSKKVMMIFSNNFVHSQWCQFELQLSLTHVMDNDDSLLVVVLEDIPSRDLTPTMMAEMKTTTYIEWEDEPEARDSFWRRILLALHEILPGVYTEGPQTGTL